MDAIGKAAEFLKKAEAATEDNDGGFCRDIRAVIKARRIEDALKAYDGGKEAEKRIIAILGG